MQSAEIFSKLRFADLLRATAYFRPSVVQLRSASVGLLGLGGSLSESMIWASGIAQLVLCRFWHSGKVNGSSLGGCRQGPKKTTFEGLPEQSFCLAQRATPFQLQPAFFLARTLPIDNFYLFCSCPKGGWTIFDFQGYKHMQKKLAKNGSENGLAANFE